MVKRIRYEKPTLIDLSDDLSCKGAACATGTDISFFDCKGGSCEQSTVCGTGTKAQACCSGTGACGIYYFGSCQTGSGVTGPCTTGSDGTKSTMCVCTATGAAAGWECTTGTVSGSCGCGMNNGT